MRVTWPPRAHDLTSYSVAGIVFVSVGWLRAPGCLEHPESHGLLLFGGLLWVLHFSRRCFECAFVHRYGSRRIRPVDAFQEYAVYWGFAAFNAWSLASEEANVSSAFVVLGSVVFALGELGNAWAHWKLRSLRPAGSTQRSIPRGGLFEWVSSPNYLCEIISWLGFSLVTRTVAAIAFALVGASVLASWARRRHQRYHALFDGKEGRPAYPARRRALVPFIF